MTCPTRPSPTPLARCALLGLGLAIALGATGCAKAGAEKGRGRAQSPTPVLVAPATRESVPVTLTAVGNVMAAESVAVRPQVDGRLMRIAFREGAPVRRGQVLFELERGELVAGLARAEAALAQEVAKAEQARAEAVRYASLAAQGYVARVQAEQQRTNAAALDASVTAARAVVADARLQLERATIRAPIDGTAGDVPLNVGALVRTNDAAPLVTLNRANPALVAFALPESQIATLKRYTSKGVRPTVEARGGGAPASGALSFVDNAVDPATGTLALRGTCPNPNGQLVPGQFVDVTLLLAKEAGLTVPTAAVLTGQKGPYVYVVQADQTVDARPIQVERQAGERTVVAGGLAPGESVVVDGQVRLAPGARVKVQKGLAPTAPRRKEAP